MKAIILAGGRGTRLRPLTVFTPKPVVPVMNRPFLLYQIEALVKAGITEITLSLSYQPNKIEDVLGDGSEHGVRLTYVTESNPLGTGGAYKFAAGSAEESAIVFNGDILTDADIASMIEKHRRSGAAATIALVPVEDPSRYGLVLTDDNDSVVSFLEKPKPEELNRIDTNLINAGIYILEPSVLELIPAGENYSFEYNVFPSILEKGLGFGSFSLRGSYWRDIGTPESYLRVHLDFMADMIKGFDRPTPAASDIATAAGVDSNSLLGEGCVIKPGAKIVNSVLGPGVHVEEKASIENSVVWAHTRVATFAHLDHALVGRSCHIGRNVSVGAGSVLGDKASLPDYSKV
jgi:mannose-1-phosphate guanylyltransferase